MLKGKTKVYKITALIISLLYIGWAVFLIVEAFMNGEASSKQSNGVTEVVVETVNEIAGHEVIKNDEETRAIVRKVLGHFGGFFILAILSSFAYFMIFYKKIALPIILSFTNGLALAFITEFIQLFKDGRSGEIKDVLIDYSGFLLSGIIITLILSIVRYKRNKPNLKQS